ncbi:MAG: hypothetical protein QF732_07265 [Nitrospinaceae bacterium]|nr:hypothetical protein [Nitrospinaceae bacterium]|tara:strand:- start:2729 stop:3268 length:540 start_codon:yes stop_codon:yes gene_type:complete
MGRLVRVLLIVCSLTGATTTVVSAQESDSADTTNTTSTPRPIEEITVVGQPSLARLRLRVLETENEIYAFFNANNSSDRMDIVCIRRRKTGSHILRRECEPRFIRDLRVQKTRDARMGIGVDFTQRDLVGWSAQDYEKLENEMLTLVTRNKEFSDKLADLVDLTENLEAHRKAMFDDEQ